MKTFVVGDIHGAYRALEQCLERCGIDIQKDRLITLGDVCDGFPYVKECVDLLLTIDNTINLIGNHDIWFTNWLNTGVHGDTVGPWAQGGFGTATSYARFANEIGGDISIIKRPWQYGYVTNLNCSDIPPEHQQFFKKQILYYIDKERNFAYVHGGFNRNRTLFENACSDPELLYWDRDLWDEAESCGNHQKLKTKDDFETIFIGHTAVSGTTPYGPGGVWNLDTGGGWSGKLTIMDVDTKEYWQSDFVTLLYPEEIANR